MEGAIGLVRLEAPLVLSASMRCSPLPSMVEVGRKRRDSGSSIRGGQFGCPSDRVVGVPATLNGPASCTGWGRGVFKSLLLTCWAIRTVAPCMACRIGRARNERRCMLCRARHGGNYSRSNVLQILRPSGHMQVLVPQLNCLAWIVASN